MGDQSVFAPVINCAFMTSLGVLEGRSHAEIRGEIVQKLAGVMRSNISFWGPITFLSYRFVPMRRRVLFGNLCSLLWMLFLISKTSKAAQNRDASAEQQDGSSAKE